MDVNRLSPGQRIAGAAGALLFIDLWLHWYSVGNDLISISVTGWQAFSWTDIFVAIAALIGVAGAVMAATGTTNPLPIGWAQLTAAVGGIVTLIVLYRIINQPGPNKLVNVEFGAYLGLVLVALMTYGAWRSINEGSAAAPAAPSPI